MTKKLAIFSSIRVRLKEVLHQYELRERHFECIIRSKELEVLLSRARAAEQKQLAEGERNRADKQDEEVRISSALSMHDSSISQRATHSLFLTFHLLFSNA